VGDQLLKIVAARLGRAVRAEDMMSRLGGDEFACLIADCHDRDDLGHLARKLLNVVSAPMQIGTTQVTVGLSIGIAIGPDDGDTAEALIRSADTAMYRAKRARAGYAFFDQPTELLYAHQRARASLVHSH
jgi:diguanylate cyclase (GGDEF)-like protein